MSPADLQGGLAMLWGGLTLTCIGILGLGLSRFLIEARQRAARLIAKFVIAAGLFLLAWFWSQTHLNPGLLAAVPQFLATGIMQGGVYALIALGFVIIYSASGIINFAQGEFVMLGGLIAVSLVQMQVPLLLAGLISLLIVTALGILFERAAIRPLRNLPPLIAIMVTIGASILIRGAAMLIWGKDTYVLPVFVAGAPLKIAGAYILPHYVLVLGITLIIMVLLTLFFRYTMAGQAMRASALNRRGAALCGINSQRMVLYSFALSAFLGAASGFIITPTNLTSYDVGIMLGMKGFAAAIIGGLGTVPGAILGGFLLGVVEALGAGLVSPQYKNVIVFCLFLAVLFIRPQGILGRKGNER